MEGPGSGKWLARGLVLVLVLALQPGSAVSCIVLAQILPGRFTTGELALLPSNAAGLVWELRDEETLPRFVVERISSTATAIPFTVESKGLPHPLESTHRLIRPTQGFEPGATYVFRVEGDPARAARVEIGERPVRAQGVARLEDGVATRQHLSLGLDHCGLITGDVGVHPIYLRLPLEARDHAAELLYQTIVDGEPWYWRPSDFAPTVASPEGPGRDGLVFDCDRGSISARWLLKPGRHVVKMRAELPGTAISWSASTEIVLRCPAK